MRTNLTKNHLLDILKNDYPHIVPRHAGYTCRRTPFGEIALGYARGNAERGAVRYIYCPMVAEHNIRIVNF